MRNDTPLVRTGDAAFAAGLSHGALLSWLDRGLFTLTDIDQHTPGSGVPRLLSLRRVYQLALTTELAGLRIPVRIAAAIASHFSDAGDDARRPGELFASGPTNLVSGWPATAYTEIINRDPPPQAFSFLAVNVQAVVAAVNGRLAQRGILNPRPTRQTTDASVAA